MTLTFLQGQVIYQILSLWFQLHRFCGRNLFQQVHLPQQGIQDFGLMLHLRCRPFEPQNKYLSSLLGRKGICISRGLLEWDFCQGKRLSAMTVVEWVINPILLLKNSSLPPCLTAPHILIHIWAISAIRPSGSYYLSTCLCLIQGKKMQVKNRERQGR